VHHELATGPSPLSGSLVGQYRLGVIFGQGLSMARHVDVHAQGRPIAAAAPLAQALSS
jgi:hypothetical protein